MIIVRETLRVLRTSSQEKICLKGMVFKDVSVYVCIHKITQKAGREAGIGSFCRRTDKHKWQGER